MKPLFKLGDKFIISVLAPINISKNCIVAKHPFELKDVVCEICIIDDITQKDKVMYQLEFNGGYLRMYENQLLNYKQLQT